jgi:DNA invertase Pin-like site-specific DNA recombinase
MFEAINSTMLDVFAAVARKYYEDRRRRQAQGQARTKSEGRYKGRPKNKARNAGIVRMLQVGRHGRASRRQGDAAEPSSPSS